MVHLREIILQDYTADKFIVFCGLGALQFCDSTFEVEQDQGQIDAKCRSLS